jgi:ActR/RegA family two-component response regulator
MSFALTGPVNHLSLGPSRNVLIVDDDPCPRESLAQWFRDARWTVRTADGCVKAFALATVATPSGLIVEQKLCGGTWSDLLSRIRARNPEVAAIVLTRYPSIAAAVHAMRMGFQDYLATPIEARKVAALLPLCC